jgi:hypothetical protein
VEVSSHGERHVIEVTLDRIAQRPELQLTSERGSVKTGTSVRMCWPRVAFACWAAMKTRVFTDG